MAGTRELRSSRRNERAIPFDVAKEEALRYITLGKDKPGCSVKQVDHLIGKGLYAEKEYREGEFIVEYSGDLLLRKDGLEREIFYPLEKGSYIYFFAWDSTKYCLDATNSKQQGRYANDAAPGDVLQNAVMRCVPNNGLPNLALFASRNIGVGEEVRYDYGVKDLPWRKQIERPPVVFVEKIERSLVWQQTSCSSPPPEDSREMQRTERVGHVWV
ncbi:N-lysine methyltransferase KMT5A-like [Saccostrea echinata]|uniref:N-lysine methyltransferase KMT5A-like n=1 Tax=Saccostrea echinata TaxID=191078 RepID=UPI002A802A06|nr:N-lysine methyltransferase KMT5A-like [Saccostrea echinata]